MEINFESIRERASALAQEGISQTKKMATIAKLKNDNRVQQINIKKAYSVIGKQYYEMYKENPDDAFAALFATIEDALAVIAANEATITEINEKVIVEDVCEAEAVSEVEEAGEPEEEVFQEVEEETEGEELEEEEADLETVMSEEPAEDSVEEVEEIEEPTEEEEAEDIE